MNFVEDTLTIYAGKLIQSGGHPMFIRKWFLIPLAVVVAGAIGAGQMDFFQSLTPTDLGVRSGKLKLPSGTDSVSSQAALYPDHPRHLASQIAPLPLRGDGPVNRPVF